MPLTSEQITRLKQKNGTELGALNSIVQLMGEDIILSDTLTFLEENLTSKMGRIKGAANYSRTFTYDGTGTLNVTVIVHTGTTVVGVETITETISYVNSAINGSNITGIVYS